jgi:type 1 glutamine amidotransferase
VSHRKKALVVRGGWEGHQPVEATELFIPYLHGLDYEVRIEDAPTVYADADYMNGVDLVMQCMTMSSIEPEELAGLRDAIVAGTGLAGWHGGLLPQQCRLPPPDRRPIRLPPG